MIHPGKDRIPYFKGTLKRLRVGPYRDAPENRALERLSRTKLTDEFGINGLRPGADGIILFAHPHARFSIELPRETVRINFRYGVLPEAINAASSTDGVEFRVLAFDRPSERILCVESVASCSGRADRSAGDLDAAARRSFKRAHFRNPFCRTVGQRLGILGRSHHRQAATLAAAAAIAFGLLLTSGWTFSTGLRGRWILNRGITIHSAIDCHGAVSPASQGRRKDGNVLCVLRVGVDPDQRRQKRFRVLACPTPRSFRSPKRRR